MRSLEITVKPILFAVALITLPFGAGAAARRPAASGPLPMLGDQIVNGKRMTLYVAAFGAPSLAFGVGNDLWFGTPIDRLSPQGHGYFTLYNLPRGDDNAITLGPDGKSMWFTPYRGRFVGKIDARGNITLFQQHSRNGYRSFGIASGPDGRVWFTAAPRKEQAFVGAITSDGHLQQYPVGTEPRVVTRGPNALMWFGEANAVGTISSSGVVTTYPVQGSVIGMVEGADGNMWFCAGSASNEFQIGRIAPDGTGVTYFPIAKQAACGAMTVAADGSVYSSLQQNGSPAILQIVPNGTMLKYPIPESDSVSSIASSPDGKSVYTVGQFTGFVAKLYVKSP